MRIICLYFFIASSLFDSNSQAQDSTQNFSIPEFQRPSNSTEYKFHELKGPRYLSLGAGFSGGENLINSNDTYLNSLNSSLVTLPLYVEFYPVDFFGIGYSTGKSFINAPESDPYIGSRGRLKEYYAIIRLISRDTERIQGWFNIYAGVGKIDQKFLGLDPNLPDKSIRSEGRSMVLGARINFFGNDNIGLVLDANIRNLKFNTIPFESIEDFGNLEVVMTPLQMEIFNYSFMIGLSLNPF